MNRSVYLPIDVVSGVYAVNRMLKTEALILEDNTGLYVKMYNG